MDIYIHSYWSKAQVSALPNHQIYCTQSQVYYQISLLKLAIELTF